MDCFIPRNEPRPEKIHLRSTHSHAQRVRSRNAKTKTRPAPKSGLESTTTTISEGGMSIYEILGLIWMHTIADFVLQTRAVAKGKGGSNKVLAWHVAVYSAPMLIFGIKFAL